MASPFSKFIFLKPPASVTNTFAQLRWYVPPRKLAL